MEHERVLKQKQTENDQLKKMQDEESKAMPKAVVPKNRRGAIEAGFPVKLSSQWKGWGVDRIGLNYTHPSYRTGGWCSRTNDKN